MKTTNTQAPQIRTGGPALLGLLALTVLASPLALAQDNGWYVGGSYGESRASIDMKQITARMLAGGFTSVAIIDDEREDGHKAFVGYQMNRFLGVEVGYYDLGKFGYKAAMIPPATMQGRITMDGWNIDLVGTLPLSERFAVLLRGGMNYTDAKTRFMGTGPALILNGKNRIIATDYKYGLGLQYSLTDNLDLRMEAERHKVDDSVGSRGDVDMYSLGLVYRFGDRSAPAVTPVSTPPPVAAAPTPRATPAPAPAPAPTPTPAPTRVAFSADSLFAFDSSTMQPAGAAELDKLIADLRGVDFDTMAVTGHTDRIGAPDYNMRLSTRRAEAVKDYLVRNGGIASAKISARGVNGSGAVTTAGQCSDSLPRAQLISCLAPDRRVEVEVTGTRPR